MSGCRQKKWFPRATIQRNLLVTAVLAGTVNAFTAVPNLVLTSDGVTNGGVWQLVAPANIAPGAINTTLQTNGAGAVVWAAGVPTTLQGAYDASAGAVPSIALTAAGSGFQIRDAAIPLVPPLLEITDATGVSHFFRVEANSIIVMVQDSLTTVADQHVLEVQDAANSLSWWPSNRTFNVAQGSLMRLAHTYVADYVNVSLSGLTLQGTFEHRQAGNALNHFLLFNNGMTFKNANGVAVDFGPGQTFIAQPIIQSDGAAVTMAQNRDFLSQPTFNVIGAGTLGVTEWKQVELRGQIGAGVTVGSRKGVLIDSLSAMAGTLTEEIGIDIADLSDGATAYGIRSVMSAGDAFVRHEGTAPVQLGGSLYLGAAAVYDVELSRGAANRLDLATGDDFNLVGGNVFLAAANYIRLGLAPGSGAGSAASQGSIRIQEDGALVLRDQLDLGDISGVWATAGGNQLNIGGIYGTAARPSNVALGATVGIYSQIGVNTQLLVTATLVDIPTNSLRLGLPPGSGAGSATGVGTVRLQNLFQFRYRNPADTVDMGALYADNTNNLWVGGWAGVGRPTRVFVNGETATDLYVANTLQLSATPTLIEIPTNSLQFGSANVAPTIDQAALAAAATIGQLFTFHAQHLDSGGAGASTGGALDVYAGDGIDADDHGGNAYFGGGRNIGAGSGVNGNVGLNARAGDAFDFQDMEGGILIPNAITLPTDNPAACAFLYVVDSVLETRTDTGPGSPLDGAFGLQHSLGAQVFS